MGLPFEPDSTPSEPQSHSPADNAATPPSPKTPSDRVLEDVYRLIPSVVFVLTTDGIVLHANPAAEKATGYHEAELLGKNLWATLFPGRLFAQVPKFISLLRPNPIINDFPMTLRTRDGKERTVAFTRSVREHPHGNKTILCIGTDLTDRLTEADKSAANENLQAGAGDAGTVDAEIVTPIAISPPIPPTSPEAHAARQAAVVQVHEFLMQIDDRMNDLQIAFAQGRIHTISQIAGTLHAGAHACGLLEFATRTHHLHTAAANHSMEQVTALVQQIVDMARGKQPS